MSFFGAFRTFLSKYRIHILIAVCVVLGLLIFLIRKPLIFEKGIEVQSSGNRTKVEFKSQFSSYSIKNGSYNQEFFVDILKQMKLDADGFGIYKTEQIVKPKKIIFSFEEIGLTDLSKTVDLISSNSGPVSSISQTFEDDVLTFHFGYSEKILNNLSEENLSKKWTTSIIRALFLTSTRNSLEDTSAYEKLLQYIKDNHKDETIIKVEGKKNALRIYSQDLISFLVPKVYAQSCSGNYGCGNSVITCTCSDPDYDCDTSGECGDGGTCSCGPPTCVSDGVGKSCNNFNYLQCVGSGGLCAFADCVAFRDCVWSGGGGGTTPAPTPTPGAGGGTWGSCGSCQTCGHSVGECQLDPSGACQWNPGSCGGGNWTGCIPNCGSPANCGCWGAETGHCDAAGKDWIKCSSNSDCSSNDAGSCVGQVTCCDGLVNGGDAGSNHCGCPVCQPSCSPACGQGNGCGGSCGTTDVGNAGNITTLNPADGGTATYNSGTGQVTISWSSSTLANKYDLELYPAGTSCSDPSAYCTYTSSGGGITGTSYSFTPTTNHYTFRVRGVNTDCVPAGFTNDGSWTGSSTFSVVTTISGRVYLDQSNQAQLSGGMCNLNGASGVRPGAGSTVSIQNSETNYPGTTVNSDGTFSNGLVLWNSNSSVTLNLGDPSYHCTCPAGCAYSGIFPPNTGIRFYVGQVGENWYQTQGGEGISLASSGNSVIDRISSFCTTPSCQPYFSIPYTSGDLTTVGSLTVGSGTNVDLLDTAGNQTTNAGPPTASRLAQTTPIACKENYEYFYRLYSMGTNPSDDFPDADPQKPTLAPGNGKNAYFHQGTLSIDSAWTLSGSESIVVFVNGDLTIKNTITMPQGTFIAFIVSGNISVDPTVGASDPSSTTGQVQGAYIANGSFSVPSVGEGGTTEKKFIGEGTFAACNGISLQRDFRNSTNPLDNNTYPSELFIFRPDLMTNAPDRMKSAHYTWREVAP